MNNIESLVIGVFSGIITSAIIFGAVQIFKKGYQAKHRVQDIWLASQAIQYNYKFLTINEKDFQDIPGLQLVVFGR